MEKILYDIYADPNLTEIERNNKIFSKFYPLFLDKHTGSFFTSPNITNVVTARCFGEKFTSGFLRVLDPACGVGEFLISAANQILANLTAEKKPSINDVLELRQMIVSQYLFGFDIDEQIIHLCKLRLLLWSLIPTLRKQSLSFTEIQTRAKEFKCNIKYGDFFKEYQMQGKFDIILCNPPYNVAMSELHESIFRKEFPSIIRNSAAYFYLLCELLLDPNGRMGFILPKSVAYSKRWRSLKNHILTHLEFIQDISKAFATVKLEEIILITSRNSSSRRYTTQDNSHEPIQVAKSNNTSKESLILSLSPLEYEVFTQLSRLPQRLEDHIVAHRGLNVQKLAERNEGRVSNPIFCLGGKEIKSFFHLPASRIIRRSKLTSNLENEKLGSILGQLANAHVKNPHPHYNLAFTYAPTSTNWVTFDTIINISLKNLEDNRNNYFIDYLLCFLNSDIFSWYLYKIVYAGAIRSTRLDAEYLNKVPFLPIQPENQFLLNVFHFLANSLIFLSEYIYLKEKSTPKILDMLKRMKILMNSLVFMLFFSNTQLYAWLNSLALELELKKKNTNIRDISKILSLLWNPTYSKILQQLRKTEQWKIIIIE